MRRRTGPFESVRSGGSGHPQPVEVRDGHQGLEQAITVASPAAAVGGSCEDHTRPSSWRSQRAQAAAKIDALVSNGADEIEIPAFLGKQPN